ncbi:MAG: hypothetical protein KGQ46_07115 [Hyphomicrobiales bacterium]|nr:hypothetical protein [Hyphomicrobiales bacterium]MDE2114024.1 hypothetical protein [Hyphomicrobiales bacterium]
MDLRQEIETHTPKLRRFARALTVGSKADGGRSGDDLVHESILRALKFARPSGMDVRLSLYASLVGLHRQQSRAKSHLLQNLRAGHGAHAAAMGRDISGTMSGQTLVDVALAALDLEERAAMLLVVLEGFNYADAAVVMDMTRETLQANLVRARATFARVVDGIHAQDSQSGARASQPAKRVRHLRLVK